MAVGAGRPAGREPGVQAGGPARGAREVGRPALTGLLVLAMAVASAGPYLIGVLAPFIIEDLHLSKASLGLLATGMIVVAAVISPLAGSLVDRFGGRPTLLCIFAVTAVGVAAMAVSATYAWLLLAAAATGIAAALANPVTNQLVSQHVPRGAQGAVIGLKQSGVQAGTFAAGLLLPSAALALGWRPALALSALPAALGLLAALVIVPVRHTVPVVGRPRGSGGRWSAVAQLTVYGCLMGIATSAIGAYLTLYAVEALALSESAGGLAVSLLGLAGIVSRILWARRSERGGPTWPLLVVMSLTAALSIALIWSAQHVGSWLLWVGALGFGSTGVAWNAVANLVLVRELPPGMVGRTAGILQLGFYAGYAAGPPSFGWLVDAAGSYGAGWLLATVTVLAAAGVTVAWNAAGRGTPPGADLTGLPVRPA